MLKLIKDLPDNVIGVTGEGKVTGKDYETVLIPAVENKLKEFKKLRILYQFGENFSEFDLEAMIDDTKLGMKHLTAWDRIALVSEHRIINTLAKFFGHLIPCEIRIFKDSEFEEAKEWVSEK